MSAPAPASTRILGVDPGSRITGYGVVDVYDQRLRHVASGSLHARGDTLAERLGDIFARLGEVIACHAPAEVAVEQVFMHRNAAAALKLGQARGAALLAGVTRGLEVFEYSPNQVKQTVTGRGHAEKQQVQHMVRVLLGLVETPASDAADALAVAICHGHFSATLRRIARREAATGAAPR